MPCTVPQQVQICYEIHDYEATLPIACVVPTDPRERPRIHRLSDVSGLCDTRVPLVRCAVRLLLESE